MAAAVLLAACGGKGDGSSSRPDYSSKANPNNTPLGKVALGGRVVSVKVHTIGSISRAETGSLINQEIDREDEINTLVLNGQRVALVPPHFSGAVFSKRDKSQQLALGNNLRYIFN